MLYFWHSIANKFLTLLSNMFTNLNLTDMEVCYKVFRREVIQGITLKSDRFGFEPEVTAKVARFKVPAVDGRPARRCRIYEIPVSYHGRDYREGKKIGWKDGFQALYCIVRYAFRIEPPMLRGDHAPGPGRTIRRDRLRDGGLRPGPRVALAVIVVDGAGDRPSRVPSHPARRARTSSSLTSTGSSGSMWPIEPGFAEVWAEVVAVAGRGRIRRGALGGLRSLGAVPVLPRLGPPPAGTPLPMHREAGRGNRGG